MNIEIYKKLCEEFNQLIPRPRYDITKHSQDGDTIRVEATPITSKIGKARAAIQKRGLANADGSIDIEGSVNIESLGIASITDIATFGIVSDTFYCGDNPLTDLVGGPKECKYYMCSNTNESLRTLKGAPEKCDEFTCSFNDNLTSLVGGPIRGVSKEAIEIYDCTFNNLTSLKGAPVACVYFDCSNNQIRTLAHCPRVEVELVCNSNQLQSIRAYRDMHGKLPEISSFKDNPVSMGDLIKDAYYDYEESEYEHRYLQ